MTDKELAEEYRKQFKQRLIDEDDFERLENFDENLECPVFEALHEGRKVNVGRSTQKRILHVSKRDALYVKMGTAKNPNRKRYL